MFFFSRSSCSRSSPPNSLPHTLGTRKLTCPNVYLRNFDDFAVLVPLLFYGGVLNTLIELIQERKINFPALDFNLGAFLCDRPHFLKLLS